MICVNTQTTRSGPTSAQTLPGIFSTNSGYATKCQQSPVFLSVQRDEPRLDLQLLVRGHELRANV